MIKVKFSDKYHAKVKRISNLPEYFVGMQLSQTKNYSLKTIENFKNGLKRNELGLQRLKPNTIKQKRRRQYDLPTHPLYGKGLNDDRAYINLLRIKELKNGWKVYPSSGTHHSGKVKLKTLFFVHEYGTIIKTKNAIIRIPPRPALFKAFEKTSRDRMYDKREQSKEVKKAISEYIQSGKTTLINQIIKQERTAIERDN